MKKTVLTLIIIMMIGSLTAAENDLWDKARNFVESGLNLVPGKIVNTTIMLNKKKEEKSRTEIITKTQQENEGISVSFIKGNRDGTDLTEEDKEVEAILQQDFKPSEDSFFDNIISYEKTSEEKKINGKDCVVFQYTGEKTRTEKKKKVNVTVTGKLWIEESTGIPVMREFVTDPLPKKVKKMNMIIYYASIDNGCTESEVNVEMLVSFLLMKFRVNTNMNFSEFWEYEGIE
ncbi:MAG: hypothetical protein K8R49_08790 [Candidatus Cloacimonetes bacterium]|nr:hypothetical protein [Candidatus Cloacimonadota bacterium]